MSRMHDGLRCQLITVVAVFLALGLGMAAGGAILGEEGLTRRFDALVGALEVDFARVREETRRQRRRLEALTAELAGVRAGRDDLVRWVVAGRLAGQRIAVVIVGETGPPQDLDSTLREAGAEVLSVSRISVAATPHEVRTSPVLSPGPADSPSAAVLALASALVNPGHAAAAARLQGATHLTTEGSFEEAPTAVLLIAAPAEELSHDPEAIDLALAKVLVRAGIPVVGAGTCPAAAEHVARYRQADLPSVDELRDPIGLVRAILLLAGAPGWPEAPGLGQTP
jgi:hypothetical protein